MPLCVDGSWQPVGGRERGTGIPERCYKLVCCDFIPWSGISLGRGS